MTALGIKPAAGWGVPGCVIYHRAAESDVDLTASDTSLRNDHTPACYISTLLFSERCTELVCYGQLTLANHAS